MKRRKQENKTVNVKWLKLRTVIEIKWTSQYNMFDAALTL